MTLPPDKIHKLKISLEPADIIIFGITGNLAQTRLLPALYHLYQHNLLPAKFNIIGFARRSYTKREFLDFARRAIKESGQGKISHSHWTDFTRRLYYLTGDFRKSVDFNRLASLLDKIETKDGVCAHRLFYFATLPSFYERIAEELKKADLLKPCGEHERPVKVIIEKPFGTNLASARRLNGKIRQFFQEEQIYRIDHYLGKETVQNLLSVRFANNVFEPIWNYRYIDHVQVTVAEQAGVQNRGKFYEETGALKDIVQNHIVRLLSLVALEQPVDLTASSIHNEKIKVLKALKFLRGREVSDCVVRAQYTKGRLGGKLVPAYRAEENVAKDSITDTFVAMKVYIANERWHQVPFYLRTGKRLTETITEISIHFKQAPQYLFKKVVPNILTLRIQPNEGIFLKFMAKRPGFGYHLVPVNMDMGYHTSFKSELPDAYERLLLDWLTGDRSLFIAADEMEASWEFIEGIMRAWAKEKVKAIPTYKAGTWGPKEAEELIRKDGREWFISRVNNQTSKQ